MPDHQILEAGDLSGRLQDSDLAIVGFSSGESLGCGKNQLRSRNAPRRGPEIWQGDHGSTAMTVCCKTLLRYMLRALHNIDTNVFSREILFEC